MLRDHIFQLVSAEWFEDSLYDENLQFALDAFGNSEKILIF